MQVKTTITTTNPHKLLTKINIALKKCLALHQQGHTFDSILAEIKLDHQKLIDSVTQNSTIRKTFWTDFEIYLSYISTLSVILNAQNRNEIQLALLNKIFSAINIISNNKKNTSASTSVKNLCTYFILNLYWQKIACQFKLGFAEIATNGLKQLKKQVDDLKQQVQKTLLEKVESLNYRVLAAYYPALAQFACYKHNYRKSGKFAALGYQYFLYLIKTADKLGVADNLFNAYFKIAGMLCNEGNLMSAIDWYESAIEIKREALALLINHPRTETYGFSLEQKIANQNSLIEVALQKILEINKIIARKNYNRILELTPARLRYSAISKDRTFVKLQFIDSFASRLFRKSLERVDINYEAYGSHTINIAIQETSVDEIEKAMFSFRESFQKQLIKLKENECKKHVISEVERVNPSDTQALLSSNDFKTIITSEEFKLQKMSRHQANKKERSAAANNQADYIKTSFKKTKVSSTIIWQDGDKSSPNNFYQIYGQSKLLTFARFSKSAFDNVPNKYIKTKFKQVAERGKVLSKNSAKGSQGYRFYKSDSNLNKYGNDYICKLKVLGKEGNHRFLGKQVLAGVLCRRGPEEVVEKPCVLIEFDCYVPKGH